FPLTIWLFIIRYVKSSAISLGKLDKGINKSTQVLSHKGEDKWCFFIVFYQIILLDYSIVVTSAGRFLAGATASGVQALAAKAEVSLPSFFGLMLFPLESPACITN